MSSKLTRIRFEESLIDPVLSGEKNTTWRLWEDKDKDLEVNETVSLQDNEGEEFAKARILWVKDTTFERLTEEDRQGHEDFESEQEMLKTYSEYYGRDVGLETKLKVIKFDLIDND